MSSIKNRPKASVCTRAFAAHTGITGKQLSQFYITLIYKFI